MALPINFPNSPVGRKISKTENWQKIFQRRWQTSSWRFFVAKYYPGKSRKNRNWRNLFDWHGRLYLSLCVERSWCQSHFWGKIFWTFFQKFSSFLELKHLKKFVDWNHCRTSKKMTIIFGLTIWSIKFEKIKMEVIKELSSLPKSNNHPYHLLILKVLNSNQLWRISWRRIQIRPKKGAILTTWSRHIIKFNRSLLSDWSFNMYQPVQ